MIRSPLGALLLIKAFKVLKIFQVTHTVIFIHISESFSQLNFIYVVVNSVALSFLLCCVHFDDRVAMKLLFLSTQYNTADEYLYFLNRDLREGKHSYEKWSRILMSQTKKVNVVHTRRFFFVVSPIKVDAIIILMYISIFSPVYCTQPNILNLIFIINFTCEKFRWKYVSNESFKWMSRTLFSNNTSKMRIFFLSFFLFLRTVDRQESD